MSMHASADVEAVFSVFSEAVLNFVLLSSLPSVADTTTELIPLSVTANVTREA